METVRSFLRGAMRKAVTMHRFEMGEDVGFLFGRTG